MHKIGFKNHYQFWNYDNQYPSKPCISFRKDVILKCLPEMCKSLDKAIIEIFAVVWLKKNYVCLHEFAEHF